MLLPATIAAVVTRKKLERRCPECGNKGVFPPSKIAEIIARGVPLPFHRKRVRRFSSEAVQGIFCTRAETRCARNTISSMQGAFTCQAIHHSIHKLLCELVAR